MGKKEKLVEKLLSQGSFTWSDLVSLLRHLGYEKLEGSGSRVKFHNGIPEMMINLHRPHPGNEIKTYARKQVIEKLRNGGLIE